MTRRSLLQSASAAALAQVPDNKRKSSNSGGLCLNEDNSHFFFTRAGRRLGPADVDGWVDQYANTQVRELLLCPNCMRTSYASRVWDPIWEGYDPDGPDDQPLLASTRAEERKNARGWVHTAWQLHRDGIDIYARWIARCRHHGISPWLTVRMNDVHNVNDEQNYLHSRFWRDNPGLRRVSYRFAEWTDRAFDYGRAEVRDHHLRLIRELADRYDFDGMELDWMRFGFHFQPGREAAGAAALTEFTAEVRRTLTHYQKRRGHHIQLSARVPSRPDTALNLGMDAITWARKGLVDMLVITPFLYVEPDMPVELWKSLLNGTKVKLAAGLELTMRPYPGFSSDHTNSLETVRGAAAALLDRGADRIYLFNYMDSQTAMDDLSNYPTVLREVGQADTLAGKPRRHVLTCSDIWAPGEPRAIPLPAQTAPGRWIGFRVPTGSKPVSGSAQVRLGVDAARQDDIASWEVRVNGKKSVFAGGVNTNKPRPKELLVGFDVPLAAMNRGHNVIEVLSQKAAKIVWVEIFLS